MANACHFGLRSSQGSALGCPDLSNCWSMRINATASSPGKICLDLPSSSRPTGLWFLHDLQIYFGYSRPVPSPKERATTSSTQREMPKTLLLGLPGTFLRTQSLPQHSVLSEMADQLHFMKGRLRRKLSMRLPKHQTLLVTSLSMIWRPTQLRSACLFAATIERPMCAAWVHRRLAR